ncbi:MAG: aminopeptidase [Anaerolineales bacterium]|nr:aminopeptidase [Anaerolineales bacterium]
MSDHRIEKLAQILVDHSAHVSPGDLVAIETSTNAEPLVRAIYELVLKRGGHPHLLLHLPDEEEIFFSHASDSQLDFTPTFQKLVTEQFNVYIRVRAEINPLALTNVPPERQSRWQKANAPVRSNMLRRGGDKTLRWSLTLFPTEGYARQAGMKYEDFENFVYSACHADENTPDPVAYWEGVEKKQAEIVKRIEGHDKVKLLGPNVDLSLSIKGRKFRNSSGQHNMPDGEIYTGPVESSVNGWVKFTYPALYQGRMVEGVELTFEKGRVATATAEKGQEFLTVMLDSDVGARYLGEFAIGTNFEINRFSRNILFDEKLGGTFHVALGAGYPETGSLNTSMIHWDMICDMRKDSEIRVDGVVIYRNGEFT